MEYNIPSKISRNFTLKEFIDKSETKNIENFEPLFLYLLPWLQSLRDEFNTPIKITSFYRNTIGVPNSSHFKGMAVDFTFPEYNDDNIKQIDIFNAILALHPLIRVCLYKSTEVRNHFFHIDCGRIYDPSGYPVWVSIEEN